MAELLSNRQMMLLAAEVSAEGMKRIAEEHMGLSREIVQAVRAGNMPDEEAFKRGVFRRWAMATSGNQVQKLAVILVRCAEEGLIDHAKVKSILDLKGDPREFEDLAEKLRTHTAQTTGIEMAPWAKAYTVDVKDIHSELTMKKIVSEDIVDKSGHETYTQMTEDHLLSMRTIKEYTELFQRSAPCQSSESSSTKKILIEAEKGYGKTTFAKKIQLDWAKRICTTFGLVFLVFLKFIRQGDTIEKAILQQTPIMREWNIKESELRDILDYFGDQCLIVVDGSDEDPSVVEDFVKNSRYNMLLTCQPCIPDRIEGYFGRKARLEGLDESQAKEYLSLVFQDQEKVSTALRFRQ